jgi:hypothetical protein
MEDCYAVLRDEPDGIYLFRDREDAEAFQREQGGILSAEPIMSGAYAQAVIYPNGRS